MVGTKQDSIKVFYINNIINHLRFQTRSSILKIKQLRDHCSNCLNYQCFKICGIWNYLWGTLTSVRNIRLLFQRLKTPIFINVWYRALTVHKVEWCCCIHVLLICWMETLQGLHILLGIFCLSIRASSLSHL